MVRNNDIGLYFGTILFVRGDVSKIHRKWKTTTVCFSLLTTGPEAQQRLWPNTRFIEI